MSGQNLDVLLIFPDTKFFEYDIVATRFEDTEIGQQMLRAQLEFRRKQRKEEAFMWKVSTISTNRRSEFYLHF